MWAAVLLELLLLAGVWVLARDRTLSGRLALLAASVLALFVGYGLYLQWQNDFISPYYFGAG